MLMRIINWFERLLANRSNDNKIKYLKRRGCQIQPGGGTHLSNLVVDFGTEPYLITIGNNCWISADVKFITHDGGVNVLNNLNYFNSSNRYDRIAPIHIGNNVYIGTGAYIMPGVSIGENSIIGARAIVSHDVPENSVAVGIPARVIENIEKYYENGIKKGWFYPTADMKSEEKRKYFCQNGLGH